MDLTRVILPGDPGYKAPSREELLGWLEDIQKDIEEYDLTAALLKIMILRAFIGAEIKGEKDERKSELPSLPGGEPDQGKD